MNYKIIYFAFVSGKFDGVEQKIIAQYDALYALGTNIRLYLISKFAPEKALSCEIEKRAGIEILSNKPGNLYNPWARRKEKFEIMSSVLKNYSPKDTIVYLRYPLADLFFLRFLIKNRAFRFVTEHQDIENISVKSLERFSEILVGKQVRRMITGFVGVTSEITDFERSYTRDKNHFFTTIGNGIDVNKYPLRCPARERLNGDIRMLFVGGGHKHHGLERLIRSMDLYFKGTNNKVDVSLKIIGNSDEMLKNKELAKRLNLNSKINFLGSLQNKDLNELFDWADIGVGSLGLHKIGLSKSSTLKTKEYFIRGLPFFWSSSDDDFPDNYPYILRLRPGDSTFDFSDLISFAERIKREEDHPQKMRQYAIHHLDWSYKMQKLISFFDEINGNGHNP